VHSGTLVSQNVPDDRHGSKELRVMRIESTQFHVATRVGVRQVFGAALSCLRSLAPDRKRQWLRYDSHGRPAVPGLH
jgi:hypothetical protein